MGVLHRIDKLLSRICRGDWLFCMGLSLWLFNAIAHTTLVWLFVPSVVGKAARYLALALVMGWYLVKAKANPGLLLLYVLLAGAIYIVARSGRLVKYSVVLIIPLVDFFSARRCGRLLRTRSVELAVSLLLMVVAANVSSPQLMDLCLLVTAAQSISFRRIALVALVVATATVGMVFLGCALGLIRDYVMGGRVRYFMGFSYALYPARYLFLITCLVCYLLGDKIKAWQIALLVVANLIVYRLTDSRLAIGCSFLILAAVVILRVLPRNPLEVGWVRAALVVAVVVCCVVGIALPAAYDGSIRWMAALNRVLGTRLSLAHDALRTMGVPLLGQEIELVGNGLTPVGEALQSGSYNYVDSLYVQVLIQYGPFFVAVYVWLQARVMQHACSERNAILAAILLVLALQGIIDDAGLSLNNNTFLLLAANTMAYERSTRAVSATEVARWSKRG